jgi:O-antigen/teichoic acid export membrane protein
MGSGLPCSEDLTSWDARDASKRVVLAALRGAVAPIGPSFLTPAHDEANYCAPRYVVLVSATTRSQSPESPSGASALRSGMVYTFASAAPRAVGFALLPVFTRVLSPSGYGQLSVALSVSAVASILFALGFDVATFRNVIRLENDPPARERFVSSTWSFLLVAPWIMAVACGAVLVPVLGVSHVLSSGQVILALIGAVISTGATTVPLVVLRSENRFRDYMLMTATNTIVSTGLSLILVVWIRGGVFGYLVSIVAGNIVTLIVALRIVPYSLPKPFDTIMVRETLKLSLPIVPHFISLWALQLADRFLVAAILGTAAAGLYSVASNLALPMFMIVLGFGQAFMPAYARASKAPDAKESLHSTIAAQVAVMSVLCLVCAALAPPAIHLLTNSQYAPAASLAPWIVLGYGFQGFYAIPMNGITLTHGNTRGLAIISGTGAATNIGLIVWLAPIYGLEAVAIASAIGYAALLGGVCLFAIYRNARLSYPWPRILAIVSLALAGYTGCIVTSGQADALGVGIRLVWIAAATSLIGAISVGSGNLPEMYRRLRAIRRLGGPTE